MTTTKVILCILIMSLVSHLPRVLPILLMKKDIESKFIQSFLFYMPYAVLSAMAFPTIVYSTGNPVVGIIGTIFALILSIFNQGLLKTSIFTVLAVYICGIFI